MEVKKLKNILTPLEKRVQYQWSGRQTTGTDQAEPGAKRENKMSKTITVNTQHGANGPWVTDFSAPANARNLQEAAAHPGSGQSGVGGYRTNVQIDDVVIDRAELVDLTFGKAREICLCPESYQPTEWDDSWVA